jgi:very-short-patch-repair endonuclease
MTTFAQTLRKESTPSETLLWGQLRSRRLFGLKFRRQQPIEQYIVDFYCSEKRLAIEVDGSIHYVGKTEIYDKKRQADLESLGITVLRFTSGEVTHNMDGVIQSIMTTINKS